MSKNALGGREKGTLGPFTGHHGCVPNNAPLRCLSLWHTVQADIDLQAHCIGMGWIQRLFQAFGLADSDRGSGHDDWLRDYAPRPAPTSNVGQSYYAKVSSAGTHRPYQQYQPSYHELGARSSAPGSGLASFTPPAGRPTATAPASTSQQPLNTSAVTLISHTHGRERREQRGIERRELQEAVKHGRRERANPGRDGSVRWRYTHKVRRSEAEAASVRPGTGPSSPCGMSRDPIYAVRSAPMLAT